MTSESWVQTRTLARTFIGLRCACYGIKFPDRKQRVSPVSSLICGKWQRLNSEAFNRGSQCQVDIDVAISIGGTRCLACPLPSSQFGLAGVGRLPWQTPAFSGAEKQPWYSLGALASISTKPLPLTTHAQQQHIHTPGMYIGPISGLSVVT